MNPRLCFTIGLVTWLTTSNALAESQANLSQALLDCYAAAATAYGSATCDPPSSLIGGVFGKCDAEEKAFRRMLETARKKRVPEYSATVLRIVRKEMEAEIQSLILDSRIKNNRNCPSRWQPL
jgi:hypothetical protein